MARGICALAVLVGAWLWVTDKPAPVYKPLPQLPAAVAPAPAATQSKPLKPVYRNSVVPGGVHSAAELAAAIDRDPVVAAHYANFNVATAHVIAVEQARMVHVSYRIGDKIYWTKNKVRLEPGETLLSDGTHMIRARCGNRIADEPEGPVLDNDAATEELATMFTSSEEGIEQSANLMLGAGPGFVPNIVGGSTQNGFGSSISTPGPSPSGVFQNPQFPGNNPGQPVTIVPTEAVAFVPPFLDTPDADPDNTVPNGSPPQSVGTPPATPPGNPPGATPPNGPPNTPPNGPPNTPPNGPPNTPPNGPPNTPPNGPPDTPPNAPPRPDTPLTPFIPTPTFNPEPPVVSTDTPDGAPVPEPESAALFALAFGVLVLVRRRTRRDRN